MRRDFYKFIYDVERNYWNGMYKYLKDNLGVRSIISGTQLRYTSPFIQAAVSYTHLDVYKRQIQNKYLLPMKVASKLSLKKK